MNILVFGTLTTRIGLEVGEKMELPKHTVKAARAAYIESMSTSEKSSMKLTRIKEELVTSLVNYKSL